MDDNTHLLLDFGDGTYANVYGAFACNVQRPSALQFAGSDGRMQVSGRGLAVHSHRTKTLFGVHGGVLQSSDHRAFPDLPYLTGVHKTLPEHHVFSDIMHLVDCVLNDKAPVVTAKHARHVIEIIDAGYRPSATGVVQELTTTF